MRQRIVEKLMHVLFFIAACASVLAVVLICLFLFRNGIPAIGEIGITKFLLGQKWKPSNNLYGILPFILGSIYVTAGSIVVGVPTALLLAVFLAFYCPKKLYPIFKTTVNLMAGVPSVVYGFFGLVVIVPLTVTGVAESALRSVPTSYYEGALALGATHERSVFFTVFPAAKSGIMAGVVLGIGRSIGETMAVIMVAGNQTWMPQGLFKGLRTMTANIVIEMGYATDLHREALIATGVVLFVFILLINLLVSALKSRAIAE